MLTFLAGFGITLAVLVAIFGTIVACAALIAVIRAAINDELGSVSKISWILACIFLPGAAFFYFAFVEDSALLKLVGWVCVAFFAFTALTGGTALWGAGEALRESHLGSYSVTCHGDETGTQCRKEGDDLLKAPEPEKPKAPDKGISL